MDRAVQSEPGMRSKIRRVDAYLVDLMPERPRTDAIQSFVKQETIFVEIENGEGVLGVGYAYTIGTGGRAVLAHLRHDLLGLLTGEDASQIEGVWQKLFWSTHGTVVGAITSLALAAIDTALWDLRCKLLGQPLWRLAGGAKRRAQLFEPLQLFWFEEPLPAEDMSGHARLAASTSIPIAVGESIYSPSHFREYLAAGAAGILQPDVARLGGITPWLKVAHLAETFNVKVAPHFLMELHVSLAAAVPNALYVEHIPQLRSITRDSLQISNGVAVAPDTPGIGIDWDFEKINHLKVE